MSDNAPTLLQAPFPTEASYTSRADHESATPSTFFGDKEVLYSDFGQCDIYVNKQDVEDGTIWMEFLGEDESDAIDPTEDMADSEELDESAWFVRRGVSGFVGSGALAIIPSSSTLKAMAIPYPAISIHATRNLTRKAPPSASNGTNGSSSSSIQTGAIYLQIEMNKGVEREDQDQGTVEVLLVPASAFEVETEGTLDDTSTDAPAPKKTKVQEIYEALCYCAELHPDPMEEDDEQDGGGGAGGGMFAGISGAGGLPSFGGGGWITSENAQDFEGEFPDVEVGEDEIVVLGPGAGSVRGRDDADDGHEVNGNGNGVDDTKWQRTG